MSDFDATFLLTSRVLVEVRSPEDRKQEKDVASFRGCNQSVGPNTCEPSVTERVKKISYLFGW